MWCTQLAGVNMAAISREDVLERFLLELLQVSERAANIARLCRAERELFELLVEEKKGDERNKQFCRDLKTLADVLIQETVRHYVGEKVTRST